MIAKVDAEVEAYQYPGLAEDIEGSLRVTRWIRRCGGAARQAGGLMIKVGSGEVKVNPGDWVVHYGQGVIAAIAPELFEERFEHVRD